MSALAPVAGTVMALTFLTGPSAVTSAVSDPVTPAPTAPVSDVQALLMLGRAANAARTTPYAGVEFVSRWGASGATSLIVDVRHLPSTGTVMRVRGNSASPGGEMITTTPAAGTTSGWATTSTASGEPVSLLARNYAVVAAGLGSVAGRSAHVVEARRPDGSVAGRFWLDDQTGLVLRREVFDGRGTTVRASAFIDLTFDHTTFVAHLPPAMPAAWNARVSGLDLARLRVAGWVCPDRLPSRLALYDVRRADNRSGGVVHSSYSDGLSTVSLFEQRGRLDAGNLTGYREQSVGGAPVYVRDDVQQTILWSSNGTVYTVIADAPADTVQQVVAALPHEHVKTGALTRVRRGLGRIASWVNPFG